MSFYSYKMTRDYGFAPNPFGSVCTLATCKPHIRVHANINDWIIGTGAKETHLEFEVIYLMKVTQKLSFEEYSLNKGYQFKKPVANGSLVQIHGDNIYSKDNTGKWIQANSQHSNPDGSVNFEHLETDISGKYVLISDCFFYFGNKHFKIPNQFKSVCCRYRDYTIHKAETEPICERFVEWIFNTYPRGINGNPINWNEYYQLKLF